MQFINVAWFSETAAQNMNRLGVYPVQAVVKVDDTVGGVEEGLNAGCWAVGVAAYSNYTDIDSMEQWEGMREDARKERIRRSREKLQASGAHYIVDSIAELPAVCEQINVRLAQGAKP